MLECHQVLAGLQGVQSCLLSLELFVRVVGSLDGQANTAVSLINLNDARIDFLAHLEDVFDLINPVLADLRDMDQAIDLMLQPHKRSEAGKLRDIAGDQVANLVELINVFPRISAKLFDTDRN